MTSTEKQRIRLLAARVAELADQATMSNLRELWTRHNKLQATRPLVLVYPEGSWREILPAAALQCQSAEAREIEWKLLSRIRRHELFRDDMVIEKTWVVPKRITATGWGLEVSRRGSATEYLDSWELVTNVGATPRVWDARTSLPTGSGDFRPVLNSSEDVFRIKPPEVNYDAEGTQNDFCEAQELLGDILQVEIRGIDHLTYHLMLQYTELRGFTQMMIDMCDNQALVHDTLSVLEAGHAAVLQQYQDLDLLSLNNNETYNATGGVGYTDELPMRDFDPQHVRPADMWSGAEAQETTHISPDMFAEFVLPHERRLLGPFGLVAYGCCEDITPRLDLIKTIPNLRRVSVSPWASLQVCAQKLASDFIFSWKPSPSVLIGRFDEREIREQLKHGLEVTAGCRLEIILKDIHTVENEPDRITRWTDIVQELVN